jgi:hypothetical protein
MAGRVEARPAGGGLGAARGELLVSPAALHQRDILVADKEEETVSSVATFEKRPTDKKRDPIETHFLTK